MSKKDPLIFIEHILDSINKIESFIKGVSKDEFSSDIKLQDALIRRIEIIGESVKNLSKEFKDKHNNIPWSEIAGMRDKLMHHYFGVNLDTVWEVIKKDIPGLKGNMLKIKKDFKK